MADYAHTGEYWPTDYWVTHWWPDSSYVPTNTIIARTYLDAEYDKRTDLQAEYDKRTDLEGGV